MLNAATRTVRSGASPNFINAMNNDDGLTTKRNTPPFSFPQEDKTGAHSIAALNRFICDSKNGSTYSDNIKASIGEKPESINPYIPTLPVVQPYIVKRESSPLESMLTTTVLVIIGVLLCFLFIRALFPVKEPESKQVEGNMNLNKMIDEIEQKDAEN